MKYSIGEKVIYDGNDFPKLNGEAAIIIDIYIRGKLDYLYLIEFINSSSLCLHDGSKNNGINGGGKIFSVALRIKNINGKHNKCHWLMEDRLKTTSSALAESLDRHLIIEE